MESPPRSHDTFESTPSEFNVITPQQAKNLLTMPLKEAVFFMGTVVEHDKNNWKSAHLVRFCDVEEIFMDQKFKGADVESLDCCVGSLPRETKERIDDPNLAPGIANARPSLVLAGGSLRRPFDRAPHFYDCDRDYFMIAPLNEEEREALGEDAFARSDGEYGRLRTERAKKCYADAVVELSKECDFATRTENCTSFFARDRGKEVETQIIHRLYESAVELVVGFDMSPCKIFSDGKNIYMTLDCMLALYHSINPVWWNSESRSFPYRIVKYSDYGYVTIYPGISKTLEITTEASESMAIKIGRWKIRKYGGVIRFNNMPELSSDYRSAPEENSGNAYEEFFSEAHFFTLLSRVLNQDEPVFYELYIEHRHILEELIPDGVEHASCECASCRLGKPYQPMDIRKGLESAQNRARDYFGDEYEDLVMEKNRIVSRTGNLPMTVKDTIRFAQIQAEMSVIYEKKCAMVQWKINRWFTHGRGVKFVVLNPGTQQTSAFNPIQNKKPVDFWGPLCMQSDDEPRRWFYTLIMCLKRKRIPVGRDVRRILFWRIRTTWIECQM